MKIDVAVKIIIVLLVVMIALVLSVIVLMDDDGKIAQTTEGSGDPPSASSSEGDGTSDNEITPPDTSESESVGPDTSETDTSEPDTSESDTSETDTSEVETTDPDVSDIPDDLLVKTTLRSDTGSRLNLVADVIAYAEDGRVNVVIEISLEHYSLTVRSKACSLVIGEETISFEADAISYSGSSAKTVIYTYEESFEHGQTLDIFIEYPFNGKYGGVEIDDIRIVGQVVLG